MDSEFWKFEAIQKLRCSHDCGADSADIPADNMLIDDEIVLQ